MQKNYNLRKLDLKFPASWIVKLKQNFTKYYANSPRAFELMCYTAQAALNLITFRNSSLKFVNVQLCFFEFVFCRAQYNNFDIL